MDQENPSNLSTDTKLIVASNMAIAEAIWRLYLKGSGEDIGVAPIERVRTSMHDALMLMHEYAHKAKTPGADS
jgi:hypothetical protein